MTTQEELRIRQVPERVIRLIEQRAPEPTIDRLPAGWLSSEVGDCDVVKDVHVFEDGRNIYVALLLGCDHFGVFWFTPKSVMDMMVVLRWYVGGGWPFGCRECEREVSRNG